MSRRRASGKGKYKLHTPHRRLRHAISMPAASSDSVAGSGMTVAPPRGVWSPGREPASLSGGRSTYSATIKQMAFRTASTVFASPLIGVADFVSRRM